jgi:hypothetical protein
MSAKSTGAPMKYSRQKLNDLVEDATADCHDEEEAVMGFVAVIEDNLELPFTVRILDVPVTVTNITLNDADELIAVCEREGKRQHISVVDLPLPKPLPKGAEWLAAYRYWRSGKVG